MLVTSIVDSIKHLGHCNVSFFQEQAYVYVPEVLRSDQRMIIVIHKALKFHSACLMPSYGLVGHNMPCEQNGVGASLENNRQTHSVHKMIFC